MSVKLDQSNFVLTICQIFLTLIVRPADSAGSGKLDGVKASELRDKLLVDAVTKFNPIG